MATSTVIAAGWTRKPIHAQVLEALTWLGHLEPTVWAGGVLIGRRPFTWEEIADRLLAGGAANAMDRDRTVLSDAAQATPSMFVLMRLCMSCCALPATGVTTTRLGTRSELLVLVCDGCAETRRAEGGLVGPFPPAGLS